MVFKELMIALVELKERNIYHNDLKPDNICYTFDDNQLNIFMIDLDSLAF
jgi:hypothetical protein